MVLFGARTGGDGIGGASILASESFEDGMPAKRPSVQVGDPFMEKVLIECCLDLFGAGLVLGIQDLGAAGISCATSELASNGDGGMHVDLEKVLLRDPTLTAGEILMSESQERMMAVVAPDRLDEFMAVIDKWDVEAAVIGEVNGSGRLTIDHFGQRIVDVDPRTVAHEGPTYERPYARPAWQDALNADTTDAPGPPRLRHRARRAGARRRHQSQPGLARPGSPTSTTASCAATPPCASPTTPASSASTRPPAAASRSPPTPTAASPSSTRPPAPPRPWPSPTATCAPWARGLWRSPTASTSARRRTPTPCGSSSRPSPAWPTPAPVMGVPVTGGNVSLYNSHGKVKGQIDSSINPTPVVGVLGVMDDVRRANPSGWHEEGLAIVALGTTADELDGSAWSRVVHDHLGGLPPRVDLEAEMALGRVLLALSEAEGPGGEPLVRAAHDCSTGGLIQTLVDSCLRCGVGASVDLTAIQEEGVDDFTALFSESGARAIVAVREELVPAVTAAAEAEDVAVARLGTTGGDLLVVAGSDLLSDGGAGRPLVLDLAELGADVEGVLPALF